MAENLDAVVAQRMAWMASLSDDDKAKVRADREAGAAEENKAARTAEFVATFGAADANQDGRLDRAEFTDFMVKLGQNAAARDVPHQKPEDVTDEQKDQVWAYFNSLSAEDGVAAADFGQAVAAIGAAIKAKMA